MISKSLKSVIWILLTGDLRIYCVVNSSNDDQSHVVSCVLMKKLAGDERIYNRKERKKQKVAPCK